MWYRVQSNKQASSSWSHLASRLLSVSLLPSSLATSAICTGSEGAAACLPALPQRLKALHKPAQLFRAHCTHVHLPEENCTPFLANDQALLQAQLHEVRLTRVLLYLKAHTRAEPTIIKVSKAPAGHDQAQQNSCQGMTGTTCQRFSVTFQMA
jgi:hypothetical protein